MRIRILSPLLLFLIIFTMMPAGAFATGPDTPISRISAVGSGDNVFLECTSETHVNFLSTTAPTIGDEFHDPQESCNSKISKETQGSDKDTWTVYSTPNTKEPTPELKLTASSHRTVIFDSYPKDGLYYYSTNGGKDWLNVDWGEHIVLSKDITTISIKRIGSNTTEDSDIQVIHLSRHTPPTGINTSTIKNGTITGVTSDMEYRNRTDLNYFLWLPITDTIVTNLAPGTYAVRVKASGTSFASDYVTVNIAEYVNKIPKEISYATAHLNKTYGDASFINELTQTIVSDEITYTSNNTNIVTVDRHTGEVTIVGPGSATITATAAETETHEQATASYYVTVGKASLTLKADDKTMTKGGVLPIFTYTPTGLVNNDTFSTPPKVTTTADGKFIGTFNITITGGSVSNHQKYNITYTNGTLTVLDSHTITASANAGGSISPSGGVTVIKGENKTFTITPDSNYSIADVRVDGVSKGKITTYTFKNVTANHSISASFSYNGGGGSSGDGSSSGDSNITVTLPPADKPNTPTEGKVTVNANINNGDNATVSITDNNVNDAYNRALTNAKENDKEANGITLVLNVSTGNKTVNGVTVDLPKTVLDTIISKNIVNTVVVVDNPNIKINIDLATVKEINKQAKSDVNITATKQDNSKLTGNAKTAIGSRPIFDLNVNDGSGKQVLNFGAGNVTVEIPYTLSTNERAGNVQAVYIDTSGKVQWLTSSVYDSVNKVLRFSTNHFSTYGVGYKTTNTNFTDTANHWAKENIEFVVSHGLFNGTSNTTFSPNIAMTRGMFVTTLGRLAEVDVSKYTTNSFSDVKADAYYMGNVEWATKNNIVNGIGDGKFAPDQSITREQMAVIMTNYAFAIGFTLPKTHAEITFTDNVKISSFAKDAVKAMQMAGVISGKDGNKFDPQGTATRAEVSTVLKRFIMLMIDSATAQGWAMNDSGKWMYYENGKALTGKQTIGGVSYTFNSYGETNDTPRDLSYSTHTVVKNESWWSIAKDYKCSMFELARINNKTIFSMLYMGDVLKVPSK